MSMANEETSYQVEYRFCFQDGSEHSFVIQIDQRTVSLIPQSSGSMPEWTRLDHEQCSCCPLTVKDYSYCPMAVNIAHLVQAFPDVVSFEEVEVRCVTAERTYLKQTSVQEGLYSIFGLIMATSACPIMGFLRPLARFHLPFATVDETIARVTSMYLLGEYFRYKKGLIPDLDLKKLDRHYAKVAEVNRGILARIRTVSARDANKNAVVFLDSIAQLLTMEIDANLASLGFMYEQEAGEKREE